MSDGDERDGYPPGREPEGPGEKPDGGSDNGSTGNGSTGNGFASVGAHPGWLIALKVVVGLMGLGLIGLSLLLGGLTFTQGQFPGLLVAIAIIAQVATLVYALYRLVRAPNGSAIIAGVAITILVMLLTFGMCMYGLSNAERRSESEIRREDSVAAAGSGAPLPTPDTTDGARPMNGPLDSRSDTDAVRTRKDTIR